MKSRLPPPDLHGLFVSRYARLTVELRTKFPPDGFVYISSPAPSAGVDPGPWGTPPFHYSTPHACVEASVEAFANDSLAELLFCVERFVAPRLREAVLARVNIVVDRWPRPDPTATHAAGMLQEMLFIVKDLEDPEPPPVRIVAPRSDSSPTILSPDWDTDVAAEDAAEWASDALNRLIPDAGTTLVADVKHRKLPSGWRVPIDGGSVRVPGAGLAVLYKAVLDIGKGLKRQALAVDASKVHHDMVGGMRDWPKDGKRHRGAETPDLQVVSDVDQIERIELMVPGSPVQLLLPMREFEDMHDSAIHALRQLRGPKGLRHWVALQKLFAIEGGRTGKLRWFLDEHLDALGYNERQRRDPKIRTAAAIEVAALTKLELAIYMKGGNSRKILPLIRPEEFNQSLTVGEGGKSKWMLDGLVFELNELIYGGVRSGDNLGRNWMPAPADVAKIDHARHPYAHGLSLLLAIRFRWRLNECHDALSFSGEKLLRLAGIPYTSRRAKRPWPSLRASLQALVDAGQLSRFHCPAAEGQESLADIWRIESSQWLLDRAARGILPEERPVDADVRRETGDDLRAWRERRGWTQRKAAEHLNVTQGTIWSAEKAGPAPLSAKLRSAILNAGPPSHSPSSD